MTTLRADWLVDPERFPRVHIIGVGGAGMSSIATVLAQMGVPVSGSDARESQNLVDLDRLGVTTFVGHRPDNVGDVDLVLRSSAVKEDNPEWVVARDRSIPVVDRREFLPLFAQRTPFISISGTHGKTTTSSMTAVSLTSLGEAPSFLIGARVPSLGASGSFGSGSAMVLEADESDGSFLAGPRIGALVTNIEPDHLDHWGSFDSLVAAFTEFLAGTAGPRVVCLDDPTLASLVDDMEMVTYGFKMGADFRITGFTPTGSGSRIEVDSPVGRVTIELAVPGRHNALNATGVLALLANLGHAPDQISTGIGRYRGAARRFEHRGDYAGIEFVDDYAHHPTELRAVISAAREGSWTRVVAVFQPHRFTRTAALWDDFARAFDGIDHLIVTDIYPAGEEPRDGIDAGSLAAAIAANSDVGSVTYAPTLDEAAHSFAGLLQSGDLALSLGAGDVTTIADRTLKVLHSSESTSAADDVISSDNTSGSFRAAPDVGDGNVI